jgi:hypothetical protein
MRYGVSDPTRAAFRRIVFSELQPYDGSFVRDVSIATSHSGI